MKSMIILLLMSALVCAEALPLSAAQNEIIVRYAGDERSNTAPFTISGPWVILYTAEGPIEIILRKKDGAFERTLIQNVQAGSRGSALQEKTGIFYLEVDAYRPWHIQIRLMD